MKIHGIETGRVKVTERWRKGEGKGIKRLLNAVFDKKMTAWLPIHVWIIEHPEGLIVIDTGIPSDANKPRYFPPYMPLLQRAAVFDVSPEDEIGPQIRRLGLNPDDVRWVVLTHLHQDHDGGLHHFPNAEIVVSQDEWNFASGFKGRMNGYLNQRWPRRFSPTLVDFQETAFGPFASHAKLTHAGDVTLVPTPGHSPGHLSVFLNEGDTTIMFAGDTSYTERHLVQLMADGVGTDIVAEIETHRKILAYAAENPTVYLPSHDPDALQRLADRAIIKMQE
ncbi:N-acyl homoserine lactonase family protein [Lutimaribacter sp. EGI FJ00015]|uniref:N-acyl homoserine lactonase family protein n=1 Tax=Lutimaribacter degradans TaxID=2945989 RepID=A0ACC5ZWI9_9RHOB|nr:N-acyl homoserine lactonase family protein [Lutimaribacter sp. EGI FJ00013]MCM2562323.1 N-acyl homoserine lactonase family protein [Lutimaribacter sp. EGI FJ00013]MCO0613478.1 N-acyl homoserine lactonase family protein [Lutimaribacter sp. EGI FJ00015]MCO0636452.1 N-acyl homoserine lactonase family protein [Lutimaribacter sp. EGI FJ00014]